MARAEKNLEGNEVSSRHAASLMLTALNNGRSEDFLLTLSKLDKLIPPGSSTFEYERKDLLEGLGQEVIGYGNGTDARKVCRSLLEHLAGPDRLSVSIH